jgi:hypothetical protein
MTARKLLTALAWVSFAVIGAASIAIVLKILVEVL